MTISEYESKEISRRPTVKVYFRFYGDSFDPDEITRRLDIEPTIKFRPGDPITEDGRGRRRGYGWMVKVGGQETLEIDELLHKLQERFDAPPSVVRQLCKDLNIEPVIVCGVGQHETTETTPVTFFPSDFVAWAAEMGASINVDIIF